MPTSPRTARLGRARVNVERMRKYNFACMLDASSLAYRAAFAEWQERESRLADRAKGIAEQHAAAWTQLMRLALAENDESPA